MSISTAINNPPGTTGAAGDAVASRKLYSPVSSSEWHSLSSYSPRAEESGSILYFTRKHQQLTRVFKLFKDERTSAIITCRLAELHELLALQPVDDARTDCWMIGQPVILPGNRSAVETPYIGMSNLGTHARRKLLGHAIYPNCSALKQGLGQLCKPLAVTDGPTVLDNERIFSLFAKCHPQPGTKHSTQMTDWLNGGQLSVVHHDFSPGNIHMLRSGPLFIDWEYWSLSYGVFNLFDVITTFAPYTGQRRLRRRTIADYLSLLQQSLAAIDPRLAGLLSYGMLASSPDAASRENLHAAFRLYLMAKASTQFRVYGVSFSQDKFWHQMIADFDRISLDKMSLLADLAEVHKE